MPAPGPVLSGPPHAPRLTRSPSPTQALVDSPEITRTVVNFKRLLLTDLEISIGKTPNKKDLAAALKEADVAGKFAASNWGKKLARQDAKKKATDFDRYKAMKAKVARSAAIKQKLGA